MLDNFFMQLPLVLRCAFYAIGLFIWTWFMFVYPNTLKTNEFKEAEFKKSLLEAVAEKKIDSKDVGELAAVKYKEIFHSSEKEATAWAENFIKKLPEMKTERKGLTKKGTQVADGLKAKWQPFYDFILQQIDDRVAVFERNGFVDKNIKKNGDLLLIDGSGSNVQNIRSIHFKNGNSIEIQLEQAEIVMGKLQNFPRIRFLLGSASGNGGWGLWIDWNDSVYGFHAPTTKYKTLIENYSTKDDPLLSVEFQKKFNNSLNNLFGFILTAD